MSRCTGINKNGDTCPLKSTCSKYKDSGSDGITFQAPFVITEGKIECSEYERTTNEDVSDTGPDTGGGDIISD